MFGKVLDAASAAYRVAKRALSHERAMQRVATKRYFFSYLEEAWKKTLGSHMGRCGGGMKVFISELPTLDSEKFEKFCSM